MRREDDTAIARRQGRGYGCRKDESTVCPARVRIVAEPLEAYVEGYVIDRWREPRGHQDRPVRR